MNAALVSVSYSLLNGFTFLKILKCIFNGLVLLSWSILEYHGIHSRAKEGRTHAAQDVVMGLWSAGYAATDIIQTLFRVRLELISCAHVAPSDVP